MLICLWVSLIVLYLNSFATIVSVWKTASFSHGFLVAPLSLYLVWLRRRRLALLEPVPDFRALPVLVLLALVWLFARLAVTNNALQFCVVTMVVITAWGVLGTKVARAMLMPLVFLFFAIPLGSGLIPKLQDFAAAFAFRLLELSNVPVLLEGRVLSLPH